MISKEKQHNEIDTSLWKRLIDFGIFDNCYPQRLNASFRYLVNSDSNHFSLKDLIQKGSFVFSYLSVRVEHESSFAIMDIFRSFDRSGRGEVSIEEFVMGVMEKMQALMKNDDIIESTAKELFKTEFRPTELVTKIEFGKMNLDKLTNFGSNFKALSYILTTQILSYSQKNNLETLAVNGIIRVLKATIVKAIEDIQVYFHLSSSRMTGIFLEFQQHADPESTNPTTINAPLEESLKEMAWDISGPRSLCDPAHLLENGDRRISVPASNMNGMMATMAAPKKRASLGNSTPDLSPGKRNGSTSYSQEEVDMKMLLQQVSSGMDTSMGQWSPESLLQPTGDSMQFGLNLDGLNSNVDNNQLFLLQNAFRSLEAFFRLSDSEQGKHSSAVSAIGEALQQQLMMISPTALARQGTKNARSSWLLAKYPSIDPKSAHHSSPEKMGLGLEEGKEGTEGKTGVELALAKELLSVQEELRRTRLRLDVLEMVQQSESLLDRAQGEEENSDSDSDVDEDRLIRGFDQVQDLSFSRAARALKVPPNKRNSAVSSELVSSVHTESFDMILSELSTLAGCISERGTADYPLGYLLDRTAAVMDLGDLDEEESVKDSKDDPDSHVKIKMVTDQSEEEGIVKAVPNMIQSMNLLAEELEKAVAERAKVQKVTDNVWMRLKQQEEMMAEHRTLIEQSELERSEVMSLTVELQVLRERSQRLARDEAQYKALLQRNVELTNQVKSLEDQVSDLQNQEQEEVQNVSDNQHMRELADKYTELTHRFTLVEVEKDRLQKENVRLKSSIKVSEQRVKGSLQDQMALHQQLQQLDEEVTGAKATITKLARELDGRKNTKDHRVEWERRIHQLEKVLQQRDIELAEAREMTSMASKTQAELMTAEKTIEELENKIGEYSVDVERGAVAINQLDHYREQLRLKTKENRDMSLHIHGLENQLNDVPYYQKRIAELSEELMENKMKVEKIPGLLTEQARLRGSSRASVKALKEQDKTLNQIKNRVKMLEQECQMLKKDNRAMQELEYKLKESNSEIKRLMDMVAEVNALKAGVKSAEEEKKSMEGHYKKMRRMVRQSGIVTAGGAAAMGLPPMGQTSPLVTGRQSVLVAGTQSPLRPSSPKTAQSSSHSNLMSAIESAGKSSKTTNVSPFASISSNKT